MNALQRPTRAMWTLIVPTAKVHTAAVVEKGLMETEKIVKVFFLGPMSREHFQKSESFILYLLHLK